MPGLSRVYAATSVPAMAAKATGPSAAASGFASNAWPPRGHVLRHRSSLLIGSSPQLFDLLGQDAGEVLPALLVAAAPLVVGEPAVRQHQVGGAAGRRHLDGHPGLHPAAP